MTTPKDRTCPNCGAGPGSPCKRPSGHAVFGGGFHKAREKGECSHTGRCVHCRHCLGNKNCWDRCQGHEGENNVTTETETKAAVGGKVRVQAADLRQALATVKGAVARRATLPVTMNVLLRSVADASPDGKLVITATDLEKAITTTIWAQLADVRAPFELTVPYRGLAEIARGLTGEVELEVEGATLTIRSGIGRGGLMGTAADEVPPLPTADSGLGLFCPLPEVP